VSTPHPNPGPSAHPDRTSLLLHKKFDAHAAQLSASQMSTIIQDARMSMVRDEKMEAIITNLCG
jgi:hypothetical protein